MQYGLLDSQTALNCSTTLNKFIFLVDITWYRGEGDGKVMLSGRPQFDNTAVSDEGVYTCVINIAEMGGIENERIINFKVIGKDIIIIRFL